MVRPPCIALAATMLAASPACAQVVARPDRAVPPLQTPAYPVAPSAPVAAQPSAAAPEAGGSMLLKDVGVAQSGGGIAMPAADWQPTTDGPSGLALLHTPGAPLDAAWIRRQFAANGMLGAQAGFDRIVALVQLINLAYLNNGFANSGVLIEGRTEDGVLNLRLVLGRLVAPAGADAIAVTFRSGRAKGLDAGYIRHRMASALAEPLDVRAIERDFRLLSDDPAIRTVNASIVPGARPGEASLAIEVDPQPRFDLFMTYANNRSPSVGGQRLGVGGSMRSWHQPGDVLGVQYGSTRGLTDFTASYTTPLFGQGWSLSVRGGFNNASVVDAALAPLDIHSREYYVEGGLSRTVLSRPLMPGKVAGMWHPALAASVGMVLVHRRVRSTLLGQPFSFSPGSRDGRTEYDALRLNFDFTRRSLGTVFAASLTGSLGLGGTRSTPPGAFTPSPHFTAALLQLNYARRLTPKLLELRLRFAGQVAGGLLYAPERFSVGGADTVRGYRESLLLGDQAAVASVELARPFDLAGMRGGRSAFRWGAFTASVFADGAAMHNRAGPQPLPRAVASAGARLVWAPADWLTASGTFGQPLRHVETTGSRNLQDRGFAFQIVLHPLGLARAFRREN
ncbi:ShlB/FhaC/HecB family hemolysin secretion/activation protein [Novosphingobium cyanobacteriorum]|uniref:ShlB/FhaC/HecB family hemolysin secretion/activation protein n=1 Tax=Novosphingobium cyanobacteriorum TaxID=3024215 RepID=A0ABT6CK99_9SPHN|nr:ShlB/FhaC/HecB family hemolysin secretion/activation protein [Novosphingobium cyanobacteriorum]MDF8334348.1 ShlB/FhaC/HecB family hemolysin secretion/activation protein [Novosphingobium cyanobacteriorum]